MSLIEKRRRLILVNVRVLGCRNQQPGWPLDPYHSILSLSLVVNCASFLFPLFGRYTHFARNKIVTLTLVKYAEKNFRNLRKIRYSIFKHFF